MNSTTVILPSNYTPGYFSSNSLQQNEKEEAILGLVQAFEYLGYIMVPLLFVIGIGGNVVTIMIMCTQYFRKLPVSEILIALALSDTAVNMMLPFNRTFVRRLLGIDVRSLSEGGCRLFYWSYRVAKTTASWMIVLVSTERLVTKVLIVKTNQMVFVWR